MPKVSRSPKLQVVARIQGHPAREALHAPLAESLGLPTEVVLDVDEEPRNPWRNYRRCLSDLPECSHVVVIQDDAVVCRNFGPAVEQIAEANPETPVVLFLARLPRRTSMLATRAMKARQRYVYLAPRDFCPVVALLWPVSVARRFMHWARDAKLPGQPDPRSDDAVVGRWMLVTKTPIRVAVPSLVEHPDMEESLIGRRRAWGKDAGRVALFLAEDGIGYEWNV